MRAVSEKSAVIVGKDRQKEGQTEGRHRERDRGAEAERDAETQRDEERAVARRWRS